MERKKEVESEVLEESDKNEIENEKNIERKST